MDFNKHKITLPDSKTGKDFKIDGYIMKLGLYDVDIEIAFGQVGQFSRFNKKIEADGFFNNWGGTYFLWVKNKNNLSTLVHELYHLVNRLSKTYGLSEDDHNEQQAYLISWLFSEIRKLK